jgi:hypothetical protein
MISELQGLQAVIEEAIEDSAFEVNGVLVTAGRPAAPSEDDAPCQTVVYVYGDNMTDEDQTVPDACIVRPRWAMLYEIWTCYPEGWEDQITTASAEDAAERLYGLMQVVWCAVMEARDNGTWCEDSCYVELVPLQVGQRSGQAVSAIGGVTIPYRCPVPESPSSP